MASSERVDHIAAAALALLLGEWSAGDAPMREQLADSLRQAIQLGELPSLTVLPSERALAQALAVSRTTVMTAYDSLRARGVLESRQGSGTWVRKLDKPITRAVVEGQRHGNSFATFLADQPDIVDFSTAASLPLPGLTNMIAHVDEFRWAQAITGHGYAPCGYAPLLDAIAAAYSNDGLPTSPDQIIVTSGSQQALELVAANHIDPGDRVIVEDPTFRGALQSWRAHGAKVLGVRRDHTGVDIAQLKEAAAKADPRFFYLLASAHNPTGGHLNAKARSQLIALAREHALLVIDDGSTSDLVFPPNKHAYLASDLPEKQVITIGSLSKVYWGGLRIGWIRASRDSVRDYAKLKSRTDLGSCILSQLIAIDLLRQLPDARRERIRMLVSNYTYLAELLARRIPDWTWDQPGGGSSLWVKLPVGEGAQFAQMALRHGVSMHSGPTFSPEASYRNYIRIPFKDSGTTLAIGVDRLAEAWHSYLYILEHHNSTNVVI